MNRRFGAILCVAVLALACGSALAAEDVEMNGQFVWSRTDGDQKGDLKAIFTPTGKGEWSVAFHFDWEDGPHVYAGTATGSMDGELEGEVENDDPERKSTFRFTGSFKDGSFQGTHGYLDGDELKSTGSLSLK